jgi:hypothetical protein
MPFNQPAPQLGDQYQQDRVLRSYLRRALPEAVLAAIEPELENMGRLAGGELYQAQLADRLNEPRHTPWDAWGNRVDLIEVTHTDVTRASTSSPWFICSPRRPMSIAARWQ